MNPLLENLLLGLIFALCLGAVWRYIGRSLGFTRSAKKSGCGGSCGCPSTSRNKEGVQPITFHPKK